MTSEGGSKRDPKRLLKQIAEVQALLNVSKKQDLDFKIKKEASKIQQAFKEKKKVKDTLLVKKKISTPSKITVLSKKSILKISNSAIPKTSIANNLTSGRGLCYYYTKFGHCQRPNCPFVHDISKIAVCLKDQCPLSHSLISDRMPHCLHFNKGRCSADKCPYLHVKVDPHSPICEAFASGYCPGGRLCRKRHLIFCPDFNNNQRTCPRGKKCRLIHYTKPLGKQQDKALPAEALDDYIPVEFPEVEEEEEHLVNFQTVPDFSGNICLKGYNAYDPPADEVPFSIAPRFT